MFYSNPRVRDKYIKYINEVECNIKEEEEFSAGKILETYSGLIRVLAYANTPILKVNAGHMNSLEVTVKLHNNTPHTFNLWNLGWHPDSAAAYSDRELIFSELYHNLGNKKYFNNTGNALRGIKNLYSQIYEIQDPSERLSYLRSLTGEKVFEFAETQFPNLKNTSSIGFSQAVLMSCFFEVNGGEFVGDMERLANSLETMFNFDKTFSSHVEPGQHAKYKSNAIYNFQAQIDDCLSGLEGTKLVKEHNLKVIIDGATAGASTKAGQLINGVNKGATWEDMVRVTEMYTYETVMATKLMNEPLNAPMDTDN